MRAPRPVGLTDGGLQPLPEELGTREGPVGAEAAISDDEVEMGVPVGQGAVSLQAGDDADPGVRLAGSGARAGDRGGMPEAGGGGS